ncbi:MAG: CHAT domain-containing protein [Phormidesmis sp.]
MSKSVIINLGSGDLFQGFPRIAVQLRTQGNPLPEQFIGALPPAPNLLELYRNWQIVYRLLCDRIPIRTMHSSSSFSPAEPPSELEISETGITHVSQVDFSELCQQLQAGMNSWLTSAGFLPVEYQLRSRLDTADLIRVIVETEDLRLRRLPWHRWNFFRDYYRAEMALSQPEYQRQAVLKPTVSHPQADRQKVKILAVFGSSQGIDLKSEARLLQQLQGAEVKCLVKPTREIFNTHLWRSEGWDILFFAGHSQTHAENYFEDDKQTGRIYINENPSQNSLTIAQLEEALKAAIVKGLQLAIFNSCDGLGLAQALEELYIPTVVVMREPVPNCVATTFFHHFLLSFAHDQQSLYLSVQQARRQLQGLENDFPAASWLPVICQNLATEPPTWLQLGGIAPCPYRGLFAFQEEDAHLFFGREQFSKLLFSAVKRMPLVAVIGPSGSGKSSAVFAGLIPQLREDVSCQYQILAFRPGSQPFEAIATAISNVSNALSAEKIGEKAREKTGQDLAIALQQNHQALSAAIGQLVRGSTDRLILIIDQFEELYTLSPSEVRQPFLDSLLDTIRTAPAVTLVLTLRADFYGHALAYRPFSDVLQGAVYNLGPMSRPELRSAIESPAENSGVTLETGLSNRLIDDVWEQAGGLPLLEFALTQLWSKQKNAQMTYRAYADIGGVEVALANHAEAVYARLDENNQQRAQRVFMQLVHLPEEGEPTRQVATRNEVKAENWDLIARLASSRLVVTSYSASTAQETAEIVHEALLKSWERLKQWVQADGDFRRWQLRLRTSAQQWIKNSYDDHLLLRWKALSDAEYWYSQRKEDLSPGDVNFIQQSLKARDHDAKMQKRSRQLTFGGLASGLVLALGLTGLAFYQWRLAHIREIEATSQSSTALFATNQKLEALVEAIRAKRSLQQPFKASSTTQTMVDLALKQATYGLVEYNRLSAHVDGVKGVAFSSNGEMIASIPENNIVQLWSSNGTLQATLEGHRASINSVSFSPQAQLVASASADNTIKLWTLDGTLKDTFEGHRDEVTTVSFSPDGQTILSASADKTIRLWNLDGTLREIIQGHRASVTDASFSPDGQTIVSASADKTAKLWKLDGTLLKTFEGHRSEVTSVAFRLDGETIATASNDKTVRLWNLDGTLRSTLTGHTAEVTDVSFSPDGETIASASADKTIKLWNNNATLTTTLEGHGDIVWSVAFSPDGTSLASASWDSSVRLWRYKNPLLTLLSGHRDGVTGVSFSPDGERIATASDDRTVKLWDLEGTLLKTFVGHQGRVYKAAFSPSGETIASASDDRTVKLWNLRGDLLATLDGHSGAIWDIRFSPDGQMIVSASDDKTIKLWNRQGDLMKTFSGHKGTVFKAIFSPDGQTIVSVSNDKTIRLWDVDRGLQKTIEGHSKSISGGDISPDGQLIASASNDKTITLWTMDGSLYKTIEASNAQIEDVAFSPDGQTIASASADDTVKLWSLEGTLLKTLKRQEGAIWGIDYSPDSQRVASASADGTVILWNLKQLLQLDEIDYACSQVRDYLKHNDEVQKRDRMLCDR